jgi:hypothetical protein
MVKQTWPMLNTVTVAIDIQKLMKTTGALRGPAPGLRART